MADDYQPWELIRINRDGSDGDVVGVFDEWSDAEAARRQSSEHCYVKLAELSRSDPSDPSAPVSIPLPQGSDPT